MTRNPVAKVLLFVTSPAWRLEGQGTIARWLEGELLREGRGGLIHLVLVEDAEMAKLNKQYLGHEGPTDVISFDLRGERIDPGAHNWTRDFPEQGSTGETFPTGEVYVSLDRAEQQARDYGVPVTDEASRLVLHGMLHLAGWDDSNADQKSRMSAREDEGLSRAKPEGKYLWTLHGPQGGRQ